ncbi:hypothetical protein M885DRAFT_580744 [Pelagophyceae sp. CCMP2097]|nr:hypothetical protein M885DRAFT_580744 [Pelagophyceae sp. CCMP2097]
MSHGGFNIKNPTSNSPAKKLSPSKSKSPKSPGTGAAAAKPFNNITEVVTNNDGKSQITFSMGNRDEKMLLQLALLALDKDLSSFYEDREGNAVTVKVGHDAQQNTVKVINVTAIYKPNHSGPEKAH